jgi:N4-gp56 family major capsid protein
MSANYTSSFSDGSASDATQSFFNTLLLVRGTYALIHQLPVKKYNLQRRSGKIMIWRRYETLSLSTTALQEGINPAGRSKTKTDVSATIAPYGDFIEDTDMVLDTQPDPHTTENVELLGQQMGESFDQIYRDKFFSLTNIVYNNGTSQATVTQVITKNALERAYRLLRVNKGRPFSPMIMPGQNIGTGPVMPSYWGLCDERLAFDLRHVDGFMLASEYGSAKGGVLAGEIGADKNGIRFLASPNGYFTAGLNGTTSAGSDVKNTSSFVDVYSLFIVGMEAIGGVNLANGNGGIIRKGLGTSGVYDALNMRATVGWKKYDARAILNQNFAVQVETCVSL